MLQDPGPQASRARSRLRTVQLGAAWLVFRPHHVELSGWLLRQHTVVLVSIGMLRASGEKPAALLLLWQHQEHSSSNGSSAPLSGLGQRLQLTHGILEGSWVATHVTSKATYITNFNDGT